MNEMEWSAEEISELLTLYLPKTEGPAEKLLSSMEYSVLNGGKRLRPRLMAEMYRLLDGSETVIRPFMAAIEMIHCYSLVHDDLPAMDNDTIRRGKPTTWSVFGEDFGILAGDSLLTYAFETACRAFALTDKPERVATALAILAGKAGPSGMAGGQSVDVEMTGKPLNKETLDYIYRLKTGALIEASLMIGAVLAGADSETLQKTERIGAAVGYAFQIRDDLLGLTATTEELGKTAGIDDINHKTTYVTLYGQTEAQRKVEELTAKAEALLSEISGGKKTETLSALIASLAGRKK